MDFKMVPKSNEQVLIMRENNMKTQTCKDKSNAAEAKEWWPATGRGWQRVLGWGLREP